MRLSDGTDDPLREFPSRPRFMHRRTYERWRRVHDDAEDRLLGDGPDELRGTKVLRPSLQKLAGQSLRAMMACMRARGGASALRMMAASERTA